MDFRYIKRFGRECNSRPAQVFTRQESVQILFDSWCYQLRNHGLQPYGFVVLENHLHAIAQANNLPSLWAQFKFYMAHEIITLLEARKAEALLKRVRFSFKAQRNDREYQFWQEGSHPQVISE